MHVRIRIQRKKRTSLTDLCSNRRWRCDFFELNLFNMRTSRPVLPSHTNVVEIPHPVLIMLVLCDGCTNSDGFCGSSFGVVIVVHITRDPSESVVFHFVQGRLEVVQDDRVGHTFENKREFPEWVDAIR